MDLFGARAMGANPVATGTLGGNGGSLGQIPAKVRDRTAPYARPSKKEVSTLDEGMVAR